MNYYHIKLDTTGEKRKIVDEGAVSDQDFLYFQTSEEDIYLVSSNECSQKDITEKLNSFDFRLERYTAISEKDFVEKVGKDKLGLFGYFLLRQKEKSCQLLPKDDVVAELDQIISLTQFKSEVRYLLADIARQKKASSVSDTLEKEPIIWIFNGKEGSGRKFAISFLERLFGLSAKILNFRRYGFPEIGDKEFPVIYDTSSIDAKDKIAFAQVLKSKESTRFGIVVAHSSEEAHQLKQELSSHFYQITIVDFPRYSKEELYKIADTMLQERAIHIRPRDLKELLEKRFKVQNAKEVRQLVQELYHFAVSIDYEYDKQNFINLIGFQEDKPKISTSKEAYKKLTEMVGLHAVKDLLAQQLAYARITALRKEKDLASDDSNNHLVFSGNPGTGKTEVARLYTEILFEHQLIKDNKLVEVGRADLIGEYVGQTAPKIRKVFDAASGGVLFIDEAYSLTPQNERDFAVEAIPALIQEMENRRDEVLVIFAGYPDLMRDFVKANPGLQSRVSRELVFKDYSACELYDIFQLMVSKRDYTCTPACKDILSAHFSTIVHQTDFGNGRYVRKLLELTLYQQAKRLMAGDISRLGKRELREIRKSDIVNAIKEIDSKKESTRVIGFGRQQRAMNIEM